MFKGRIWVINLKVIKTRTHSTRLACWGRRGLGHADRAVSRDRAWASASGIVSDASAISGSYRAPPGAADPPVAVGEREVPEAGGGAIAAARSVGTSRPAKPALASSPFANPTMKSTFGSFRIDE